MASSLLQVRRKVTSEKKTNRVNIHVITLWCMNSTVYFAKSDFHKFDIHALADCYQQCPFDAHPVLIIRGGRDMHELARLYTSARRNIRLLAVTAIASNAYGQVVATEQRCSR
ncbi:uncharacterized protein LOC111263076 [Varroa jacobsoni]|uniref:uncharacterized protein LOC111263076 n=1 Tax=Varroa jacobsoni TaxID=62625 RepID=UPI000BF9936A|nr:uncharacterized protein LOC111263076 [Varroa jacobsoni]